MIKAIIIDDELRARETLEAIIVKDCQDVSIIGIASDAKSGYDLINKMKPDVVFLDIEMPKINGFELLEMFDHVDFNIVFTTAYDYYAIQAIKLSALDYILKPINVEELKKAVSKAINKVVERDRVDSLLSNLKGNGKLEKLVLPSRNNSEVVNLDDILFLQADGSYTTFILTNDRRILMSKPIGKYEELLEGNGFVRIHQSTIINLTHVIKYKKGDGGKVLMRNGDTCKISRQRKQDFLTKIESNKH